ncbi:type II secretion system protein GspG [Victivallis lenta]|uniref:type II secretion system protein GspG n=1 Tax=Victivallis lenta TaxID=2606640 RepID=UPI0015B139FC|nr:type II secretion system protein GspG [Victivallis lenta]
MKKRFTLTEVLVVVFLIGVLTAIGFGMYSYAMNSAKESATRALFSRLNAALESCNTKFGIIPPSTTQAEFNEITVTVDSTSGLIKKLEFGGRTFDSSGSQAEKDYLKEFLSQIDAETLKESINSNDKLEDSWGNPIFYAYPGKFNKTGYDLYSAGPDGNIGKPTEQGERVPLTRGNLNDSSLIDFKDSSTNELLSDDIFNF